jgi:hypothetical protein
MPSRSVLPAIVLTFVLCLAAGASRVDAAEWQPAKGPLITQWAKDVTPAKAHPEYPRPQMVRKDWMNLNGLWQYAEAGAGEQPPTATDLKATILVPFPIESALSGVMKQAERLWYRRTFSLPPDWVGRRVLLHFGAVDWEATVIVNGRKMGEHRGGYDPFTFDITEALLANKQQEIVVGVFDPTDAGQQPRGKQVRRPGGIMYTPTSGIWQTVWLEPVPKVRIEDLIVTPDVDGKCLRVKVLPAGDAADLTVEAVATDAGKPVGKAAGRADAEISIPIENAKLWSPDAPFLYDLKVELRRGADAVDAVASYFGMRKVSLGKDEKGITRPMINGKFIMQVGPLDQGFWPDGIYAAATDEALRWDIEMTRKLGFNMARKHVKIEPDRWYYWADKLGLMVWQDMPSGNNGTPEAKKQFEVELRRMVEAHRNHPSIIMWVVFNEGWGQYDTERLTAWVKELDPTRLVNNASGWTDKNVGDVHDVHSYPNPACPKPEEKRAAVLGEFGGLGLGIDGHTWKKEHWGYKGMASSDELTRQYETLLMKAYKMVDNPGLCAAVYTQITDVEVECNGLLTYDRAMVKGDLERLAAANRGDFSRVPPPPVVKAVVPTSEERAVEWRYATDAPAANWFQTDFDDSSWKKGPGGFGARGTPGSTVRTDWKTADIWLRREFDLPQAKFTDLQLRIHHDEDAEVYINGVKAAQFKGFLTEYQEHPLSEKGKAALKPGKNVIAIHCRQTGGGQYIDAGIADVIPAKPKQ